jgi:phosphonate transport system substrate-binding protein
LFLNAEQTITIGSVSDDPSKEFKAFTPLMAYIKETSSEIDEVKLKVYKSLSAISKAINKKEVDFYVDSPFSVKAICIKTKSTPLWRRWKKGTKDYSSVIFSLKKSGPTTMADLKGNIIAFEERYSSSSYLLPKLMLLNEGIEMLEVKDTDEEIPDNKIGYIFTQDDATTMFWVLRKKVIAGAMSHNNYIKEAKKRISKLRIIKQSKKFPRHVICVRPNFPANITKHLEETLFDMHSTKAGKAALLTFSKTLKFDTLSEESKKDMNRIEKFIIKEFDIK